MMGPHMPYGLSLKRERTSPESVDTGQNGCMRMRQRSKGQYLGMAGSWSGR